MSYTKKTWSTGDTITADALNNLESGASANASAIAEIEKELPSYVGADVPRKAAETITPGTENQTIAANQYLTGAQTIKGDGNLSAGNIKKGVSIFGVAGTYAGSGGSGSTIKTGSFTGAETEAVIETGLSSISAFMVYDTANRLHAAGLVCAFVDVEGGITGRGIGCTSYSQYITNVSVSENGILKRAGGTITILAQSAGYKPISNATYKWYAVGEA